MARGGGHCGGGPNNQGYIRRLIHLKPTPIEFLNRMETALALYSLCCLGSYFEFNLLMVVSGQNVPFTRTVVGALLWPSTLE